MKRPNKFLYIVLNQIARIYTKVLKNHHYHNPSKIKIKTPAIIISNHTSFFDFLYVMWACKNTPVNFVVARKYYETKPLSTILKLGHSIPKSLFQSDLYAIRQMLSVIKANGIIGIFPEGQISVTGVTLPFPSGLGKFIKLTGIDVYGIKTTGAYLMDPPWTNIKRKGRIDSELFHIIDANETKNLTVEEIETRLYQAIYTNPYLDKNSENFKGKNLAVGLDSLLYICPNCQHEGFLKSYGNELKCEKCHQAYTIKANGRIVDKDNKEITIFDAYQYQRNIEREKIIKNENYSYSLNVKVESIRNKKYQIVSNGTLIINHEQIKYLSNKDDSFVIKTSQVRYVPFDNGKNFQIYRDDALYQFIPDEPYEVSKATNIIELMYEYIMKDLGN